MERPPVRTTVGGPGGIAHNNAAQQDAPTTPRGGPFASVVAVSPRARTSPRTVAPRRRRALGTRRRGGTPVRAGRVPAPDLLRLQGLDRAGPRGVPALLGHNHRRHRRGGVRGGAHHLGDHPLPAPLRRDAAPVPVPHPPRDHLHRSCRWSSCSSSSASRWRREQRRRRRPHPGGEGQRHGLPVGMAVRLPRPRERDRRDHRGPRPRRAQRRPVRTGGRLPGAGTGGTSRPDDARSPWSPRT